MRASLALAALGISTVLSACGGGGGGGGAANSWLSFTPSPITATVYEGETQAIVVTATSSKTISEVLNVAVIDAAGVSDGTMSLVAKTAMSYEATLNLSTQLAAGTHSGNLEVRLCRDDPATCANPYPGSPWKLPYTVNVKSSTNLTTLRPLAGAAAWTTFQGSARHTGYVPATIDPANFSRRFRYAVPAPATGVAAENGLVVVGTGNLTSYGPWVLHGVSEATGQAKWTRDMGTSSINAPAMVNGEVYAITNGWGGGLTLLDAASGNLLSEQGLTPATQGLPVLAPTVDGSGLYSETDAGVVRLDAQTGVQSWYTQLQFGLNGDAGWTPAVQGGLAYVPTFVDSKAVLIVINTSDGSAVSTIADSNGPSSRGFSMTAPVLGDGGFVYVSEFGPGLSEGRLAKFDTLAGSVSWSVGQAVVSLPVLAGGTVYTLEGNAFQARSAATGAPQWSWTSSSGFATPPEYLNPSPLLVVGNHAFFCTFDGTVALDLTTRRVVWLDPAVGSLAVSSNGILYISGVDALTAVNLH